MGPLPQSPSPIEEGWGRGPFFIIKVLCKHSIQAVLKKNEWLCNEYYGQNAFMTKINDYFGNSKKNCIEEYLLRYFNTVLNKYIDKM